MVARVWQTALPAADAGAYFDYLRRAGIAGYTAAEGNCGVYVFKRVDDGQVHVLIVSLWESAEMLPGLDGPTFEPPGAPGRAADPLPLPASGMSYEVFFPTEKYHLVLFQAKARRTRPGV